ncbi:hypothetical protein F0562_010626 [Nyssa sinensis]|uniref:Uncharacterized protein n=1 Tax=Nyssa sinensis TaxID=561372 RepID=A0A5J4ZZH3_9ASTE|nr:hypothetical protein F0562_010626 [Nyssa sinensis]
MDGAELGLKLSSNQSCSFGKTLHRNLIRTGVATGVAIGGDDGAAVVVLKLEEHSSVDSIGLARNEITVTISAGLKVVQCNGTAESLALPMVFRVAVETWEVRQRSSLYSCFPSSVTVVQSREQQLLMAEESKRAKILNIIKGMG